jgi:hypothetical protein
VAEESVEPRFLLLPDEEPQPLAYWLGDEPEHDIADALGVPRGSVSITEVVVLAKRVRSITLTIEVAEVTE